MTDSQDNPKNESFPRDCRVEDIEKKDDVPLDQTGEALLPDGGLEPGERLHSHHPAGRRPLFRN